MNLKTLRSKPFAFFKPFITTLFLACITTTGLLAQTPSYVWAKTFGSTNAEIVNDIATNAAGDVYVTGYFRSSSINFGNSVTLTNPGTYNVYYLVKYNASGVAQWAKTIAGTPDGTTEGKSVAIDGSGNVVVCGSFGTSTLQFGSLTALTNAGGGDLFLVKYNSSGVEQWSLREGGSDGSEEATGVAVDAANNIYIVANFYSTSITIGGNTINNVDYPSNLYTDALIVKYDPTGVYQWAKRQGGTVSGNQLGTDICINPGTSTVFICGTYSSSTFYFGNFLYNHTITNQGGNDGFVAKFDTADGSFKGSVDIGTTDAEYVNSIACDAGNSIYVTGSFGSVGLSFAGSTLNPSGSFGSNFFLLQYYDGGGNNIFEKRNKFLFTV